METATPRSPGNLYMKYRFSAYQNGFVTLRSIIPYLITQLSQYKYFRVMTNKVYKNYEPKNSKGREKAPDSKFDLGFLNLTSA